MVTCQKCRWKDILWQWARTKELARRIGDLITSFQQSNWATETGAPKLPDLIYFGWLVGLGGLWAPDCNDPLLSILWLVGVGLECLWEGEVCLWFTEIQLVLLWFTEPSWISAVDPGVKGKHLIKKVSDYVAMWSTWLSGKVVLCWGATSISATKTKSIKCLFYVISCKPMLIV